MYVGRAKLNLVEPCIDEPRTDAIARLATNPVVTFGGKRKVDRSAIADLARRLPTVDEERLLEEIDDNSADALQQLFEGAGDGEAAGADDVEAVRNLLEAVDLPDNVDIIEDGAKCFDARMEVDPTIASRRYSTPSSSASSALGWTTRSTKCTMPSRRSGSPAEPTTRDVVEIVWPRDAHMQSYSHLERRLANSPHEVVLC